MDDVTKKAINMILEDKHCDYSKYVELQVHLVTKHNDPTKLAPVLEMWFQLFSRGTSFAREQCGLVDWEVVAERLIGLNVVEGYRENHLA